MKVFRTTYVSNTFALFTGLVFLNMSFFLAEISALKLSEDKKLIENVAKLIAGSASEEESDAPMGSPDEDASAKEIDLIFHYQPVAPLENTTLAKSKISILMQGIPRLGHYEIYSPPPEI